MHRPLTRSLMRVTRMYEINMDFPTTLTRGCFWTSARRALSCITTCRAILEIGAAICRIQDQQHGCFHWYHRWRTMMRNSAILKLDWNQEYVSPKPPPPAISIAIFTTAPDPPHPPRSSACSTTRCPRAHRHHHHSPTFPPFTPPSLMVVTRDISRWLWDNSVRHLFDADFYACCVSRFYGGVIVEAFRTTFRDIVTLSWKHS